MQCTTAKLQGAIFQLVLLEVTAWSKNAISLILEINLFTGRLP